jgi:hypothetical protein
VHLQTKVNGRDIVYGFDGKELKVA